MEARTDTAAHRCTSQEVPGRYLWIRSLPAIGRSDVSWPPESVIPMSDRFEERQGDSQVDTSGERPPIGKSSPSLARRQKALLAPLACRNALLGRPGRRSLSLGRK